MYTKISSTKCTLITLNECLHWDYNKFFSWNLETKYEILIYIYKQNFD